MDKIEVTQADRVAAEPFFHWMIDEERVALMQAFARHRLATRTDATPVAWMYSKNSKVRTEHSPEPCQDMIDAGWKADPLYPDPPATDVAALVEVLRHVTECLVVEMGNLANEDETDEVDLQGILGRKYARQVIAARLRIRQARQALAPFTKGQDDDA